MGSIEIEKAASTDFDVIIVGAGISGINAAYRVQTELPGYNYTILESRGAIGGTWDLFRYPGIRSDSDLHTFGFPWSPWTQENAIADGASIRNYIVSCAEKFGIDEKIRFHHKLVGAAWSSSKQQWSLSVDSDGEKKTLTTKFIVFGTGYYDYNKPLETIIPGIDNFKGQVIHPQFWPEDLDYSNKKIVVIGSGATAVTLVPSLAEKAEKVTMLQRSPTYVLGLPASAPQDSWVRNNMPAWFANRFLRIKFIVFPLIFFMFCRTFPNVARKIIRKNNEPLLPDTIPHDPNFNPKYNPWEQRLCVCPDGDFFTALRSGKADVVTESIQTVTETSIKTVSGKTLDADIIITATGLKLSIAGDVPISVDGTPVTINSKFFWRSVMLQDVPNAIVVIGYSNASWTLGSDTTATIICRLLKHMETHHYASVTPRVKDGDEMKGVPILNINSTYIEKAKGSLPKSGDRAPWKPRNDFFTDSFTANYASIGSLSKELDFVKMKAQ